VSLALATIKRAESSENETAMTVANDLAVRRALEVADVEFIEENGGALAQASTEKAHDLHALTTSPTAIPSRHIEAAPALCRARNTKLRIRTLIQAEDGWA
jgi:hypothetical protein